MGIRAHGTMVEFAKNAQLKEEAGVVPTAEKMVKNLLHDHESIIRHDARRITKNC